MLTKLRRCSVFQGFFFHYRVSESVIKKSRIRETKHLSTDADSSTDTTVGLTRSTQKPKFLEKRKKSSKTQKLENFDQRSLIHREVWFLHCFVRQNQPKNKLFLCRNFRPLPNKNVPIWDHFFSLLFPKDSESLKILDIRLWEVVAKRCLNSTSKVNTQTDGQTDRRTNRQTVI